MSSIVDYNKDSKLRYNRLYNTKATMLNDYTRNAIYKRTACLNNFGYSCDVGNTLSSKGMYRNKDKSCPTPYENIEQSCNPQENAYSEKRTPPPIFMDKFYNALPPINSRYDINVDNLDVKNMTKTDYYYAVSTEQSRTTTGSSVTNGLKGPIEFILASKSDPEQTIHYWSTDGFSQTTNEFIDKQTDGEHVYITLRIHQANYSGGKITVMAYSQEKGKEKSGVTKHTFFITGYDSVTAKPENGKSIPYYFEYLTNWFDIDPTSNNQLYAPKSGGINTWTNEALTEADKAILANYISWLNSYAYDGPTSKNRDKLGVGFKDTNLQLSKALTYTYGTSPTIPTLVGATLDDFISFTPRGWLQGNLTWDKGAGMTGLDSVRVTTPYTPDKVDFRMNGDDIEVKTFGSFKLIKLIGITNTTAVDILKAKTEIFAYPGFTISYNEGGGTSVGTFATVTLSSTVDGGMLSDGWTKIASLKNTQRDVFYLHMTRVHTVTGAVTGSDGSPVTIQYDLETSRDTDTIDKTYFAKSMFEGVWLESNLTDAQLIEQHGVFGFNYHNQYTIPLEQANQFGEKFKYITGTQMPSGNVTNVEQVIIQGRRIDYSWERVGYLMPHTKVNIGRLASVFKSGEYYSTSEYGIRGIRIPKDNELTGVPVPGSKDWEQDYHYVGYGYNETTKLNKTKPQGLGSIYSLPGIKTVRDLVGYKLIRRMEQYNPRTYIATGNSYDIEYTICGSFLDDQTDINNYYVSFATVKPTVSGTDSNFSTNLYNLQNRSAGMWVAEDFLNKTEYRTRDIYLFVPTEFPDTATQTTLKPFNYHPDGRSVILSVSGPEATPDFYSTSGGNMVRSESNLVITDAYIKNPSDHTLIGDGKRKDLVSGTIGGQ